MPMPKENESDSACGILITDSRAIKGFMALLYQQFYGQRQPE